MEFSILSGAGIMMSLPETVELWNASNPTRPVDTFWELFATYHDFMVYHSDCIISFESSVPPSFGHCGGAVADNRILGYEVPFVFIHASEDASLFEAAYLDADELVTEIQQSHLPLTNASQTCYDFLANRLCQISMAYVDEDGDEHEMGLAQAMTSWGAMKEEANRKARKAHPDEFAEDPASLAALKNIEIDAQKSAN